MNVMFLKMGLVVMLTTTMLSTVIAADKVQHWGTDNKEALAAMDLKGSVKDGAVIYEELCEICHQPGGNGDPAGNFPQLAGQHATVVIKQIADIRAMNRDNPTMFPFANVAALKASTDDLFDKPKSGPQVLADVSAFIRTLKMSLNTPKGSGKDLVLGEKLYKINCVKCHGDNGQGISKEYFPLIQSQNYHYLVRQFKWIKEGKRRNANPEMVKQIKNFTDKEVAAVLDFVSRQKPKKK